MIPSIDRRGFLRAATTAGAIGAMPEWLARGFGVDPQGGAKQGKDKPRADRQTLLRKAYRRAVSYGKPLLVFVVPQDKARRFNRGQLHGTLLTHGGRAVLFDLALCELACGTTAELLEVLPDLVVKGEPLIAVIEPPRATGAKPRGIAIDPDLSEFARPPVIEDSASSEVRTNAWKAHARGRNAVIARVLREVVAADRGALLARDNDVRASLADDEQRALDGFLAGGANPGAEFLVRTAALVRVAAEAPRRAGDRKRLLDALAAAAEQVVVKREIPGSKWATTMGCGVLFEGESALGTRCGMGFVPPLEERFLYFFTDR